MPPPDRTGDFALSPSVAYRVDVLPLFGSAVPPITVCGSTTDGIENVYAVVRVRIETPKQSTEWRPEIHVRPRGENTARAFTTDFQTRRFVRSRFRERARRVIINVIGFTAVDCWLHCATRRLVVCCTSKFYDPACIFHRPVATILSEHLRLPSLTSHPPVE